MSKQLRKKQIDDLVDLIDERTRYKFDNTEISTDTLDSLVSAAGDYESLRTAIQKHEKESTALGVNPSQAWAANIALWETLLMRKKKRPY